MDHTAYALTAGLRACAAFVVMINYRTRVPRDAWSKIERFVAQGTHASLIYYHLLKLLKRDAVLVTKVSILVEVASRCISTLAEASHVLVVVCSVHYAPFTKIGLVVFTDTQGSSDTVTPFT
jgi:hypothetical protein